ncbi:hypothetical protein F444_13162 [Phytophthora nicotianae P1976]|uniref:Chitin-binding type-4 domain-containing protein n=1 Tax=Phytophthora nicotianae P1976 TaxID=1317066 RepID=A0A080ZUQ9_PHYNI|nr:hypothetical protein F444_13162 [Phytophthora nicotianae P1976]
MKIPSCSSFLTTIGALLLLAAPTTVTAHGQMTKPTPRPISQKYRADSGALSSAGDQELQYAPVELLSSRAQSDRPAAATFNIMNGCRGTVYEASNTVTKLEAGTPFDVEWVIQAPHPGTMVLSIVKPSTDISGTNHHDGQDPNKRDGMRVAGRLRTAVLLAFGPGESDVPDMRRNCGGWKRRCERTNYNGAKYRDTAANGNYSFSNDYNKYFITFYCRSNSNSTCEQYCIGRGFSAFHNSGEMHTPPATPSEAAWLSSRCY